MKKINILGMANEDLFVRSDIPLTYRDSLPGTVTSRHGGVGRNIAETLGRLGVNPAFFSALSSRDIGQFIREHLESLNVTVHHAEAAKTSRYVAFLDDTGDLHIGVNDMKDVENALSVDYIESISDIMYMCDFLLLDANAAERVIGHVIATAKDKGVPLLIDGTSKTKIKRLIPFLPDIHTLKLNIHEAEALLDRTLTDINTVQNAAKEIQSMGPRHVYVTAGQSGAAHASEQKVTTMRPPLMDDAINTTGAGDAFLAGIAYALVHDLEPLPSAIALSSLTLMSEEAVNKALDEELFNNYLRSVNHANQN